MITPLLALWTMASTPSAELPNVQIKDLQLCFDAQGSRVTDAAAAHDSLRENASFDFNDYLTTLGHGGLVRGLYMSSISLDENLLERSHLYRATGRACVNLELYSVDVSDAVLERLDPEEHLSQTSYLSKTTLTQSRDGVEDTQRTHLTIHFTNRALPWVNPFRTLIGDYEPSWELCAQKAGVKTGKDTYTLDKTGITKCYTVFAEAAKKLEQ